jgi:hypothetical protein
MRHSNVLYLNVKPYVKTLSVNEMIRRYLDSGVIPSHNIKRFTDTMNERMGNINNKNNNNNPVENMKINLHESNYISLNTPSPDNVSKENKDTNEKLFNYIKLFLKDKQYSKKSTKNNSRNDSQTRRHYRAKHHLNVGIKTRKYKKSNRNSDSTLHNKKKTRRVGRFMRI